MLADKPGAAGDTCAEVKAGLEPPVAAHLPFAKAAHLHRVRRRVGLLDGPAFRYEQQSVLAGVWLTSAGVKDDQRGALCVVRRVLLSRLDVALGAGVVLDAAATVGAPLFPLRRTWSPLVGVPGCALLEPLRHDNTAALGGRTGSPMASSVIGSHSRSNAA